jgi:hypothetical protein
VWRELLGVSEVWLHDNFFELGGNSLLMMQVAVKAGHILGRSLSLGMLMQYPTVESMAACADCADRVVTTRAHPVNSESTSAAGERTGFTAVCFPSQSYMLYFCCPQDDAWMNTASYWLRGQIDVAALRQSFHAIISRHEALRTSFWSDALDSFSPGAEMRCFQQVAPPNDAGDCVTVVDLSNGDAAAARSRALAAMDAGALSSIDVALAAELFRVRLWKVGALEHLLCIEAHHAVLDGTSWGLLAHELAVCYGHASDSTQQVAAASLPPSLPALPLPYTAWSTQKLRAYTTARTADAACELIERMRGGENRGTTVPTDRPRALHRGWYQLRATSSIRAGILN